VLDAIINISVETGYPPAAEELAAALDATTRQVHSALLAAKRRGAVRYDDDLRLVVVP
jgi:DNA-directed RNA polymerase specialized sigma subunit